jgi:hypothetical protein
MTFDVWLPLMALARESNCQCIYIDQIWFGSHLSGCIFWKIEVVKIVVDIRVVVWVAFSGKLKWLR